MHGKGFVVSDADGGKRVLQQKWWRWSLYIVVHGSDLPVCAWLWAFRRSGSIYWFSSRTRCNCGTVGARVMSRPEKESLPKDSAKVGICAGDDSQIGQYYSTKPKEPSDRAIGKMYDRWRAMSWAKREMSKASPAQQSWVLIALKTFSLIYRICRRLLCSDNPASRGIANRAPFWR